MKTLYTVSRCRKDDTLFGPTHGSDNAESTVCGQIIDVNWYIVNTTFQGIITCKKCLKIISNYPSIPQRIERKRIECAET